MKDASKVSLLVLAALLAGCSKEADTAKDAPSVPVVQLAEVKAESIDRGLTVEGVLRALDQSAVTPKISAPVSKFLVNRGDHVRAGQLIAVLEGKDLMAAVADAKGTMDQAAATLHNTEAGTVPDEVIKAQTDVLAAKETMDAAKKVVDSRTELLKQGAIARKSVDDANVAYVTAKSAYDVATKHLESVETVARHEEVKVATGGYQSAKGKYENAQAQLSYTMIFSPIGGIVADRSVFPGEMAVPGMPLLTIMDISSVIARVNVPQTQANFVHVGQSARIVAADGSEATGKVTVVSPALDPQGTTVEVWVQADNPAERLRPGGTVRVTINAEGVRNAVVVPPAALLPASEGGSAVFTVGSDMIAKEQRVTVGIRTADKAQILSGVDAGARVVVSGGLGLQDGAKVKLAGAEDKSDKSPDKKDSDKKDNDKKDSDKKDSEKKEKE
jgi:multidrug efflux pump subunit AcrA (membrane-fusion protein)